MNDLLERIAQAWKHVKSFRPNGGIVSVEEQFAQRDLETLLDKAADEASK